MQRKLKEACLAIKLNQKWSKQRILTTYLNQVYYGTSRTASRPPRRPTSRTPRRTSRCAGGVPRRPHPGASAYDPFASREGARTARPGARRDADQGAITAAARWAVRGRASPQAGSALHGDPGAVLLRVRPGSADPAYGPRRCGRAASRSTRRSSRAAAARASDPGDPHRPDDPAAAVISVDPPRARSGRWRPSIPGRANNQFNLLSQARASRARRSRRSCSPLRSTKGSTPTRARTSRRRSTTAGRERELRDGSWWCVKTYDSTYTAGRSISRATLRSDNTVFAQLTLDVDAERVGDMARARRRRRSRSAPTCRRSASARSRSRRSTWPPPTPRSRGRRRVQPTAIRKIVLPNGKDERRPAGARRSARASSPTAWPGR